MPPGLVTPSEASGFAATASYSQVLEFCERLAAISPDIKLSSFGVSGQGRRLPVVVASRRTAGEVEGARPVVLVLNSIHGGEVDGTDASLALLRDLALGRHKPVLTSLTLVVVPIYNVDGHARVSRFNRPNQSGPVDGMGFRTNAQGLDLNRDFLKADAPETRALLALAAKWKPDLFIDDHVTDGADYQPTLTLSYANEPVTPKPLADYLRGLVPKALRLVEDAGFATSPYIDFLDYAEPSKGIDAGPSLPRYATGYFPLRGAGAILVETHAIKPFGERVKANERFLAALLELLAKDPSALRKASAAARAEVSSAPIGAGFAIDFETDYNKSSEISFPTFEWIREISVASGKPVLRYDRSKPKTIPLKVYEHAKAKATIKRPAAYVIPAGWPNIEERLRVHGIPFERLGKSMSLNVGTYRATEPKFAAKPYQGRFPVTAKIATAQERREIPAGSIYIPLNNDLAAVTMHLLEPEGRDSLFQWGELSTALELKEYIDTRILDPLAAEMLTKDPRLKAEWEERLKDPTFAADERARVVFFYSRTPYWDESVGLLPIYRLEAPIEAP